MKKKSYFLFTISINDGYREWSYEFYISGKNSINSIMQKIEKKLGVKMSEGKLREEFKP